MIKFAIIIAVALAIVSFIAIVFAVYCFWKVILIGMEKADSRGKRLALGVLPILMFAPSFSGDIGQKYSMRLLYSLVIALISTVIHFSLRYYVEQNAPN